MDEPNIPDLIGVGAQAIVANAQRLGLTWTMRLATVVTMADLPTGKVQAIYDGDTEPLTMTNASGRGFASGDRIYAITVPPSGNYVVGTAGNGLNEDGITLDSGPADSISTTTMTSMSGASFSFAKYGNGRLRIDMAGTFFTTSGTIGAGFGVAVNGTDYLITGVWHNLTANVHTTFAGSMIITDPLPPATYDIIGIWRASTAGAGPTRDTSDFLTIMARELAD